MGSRALDASSGYPLPRNAANLSFPELEGCGQERAVSLGALRRIKNNFSDWIERGGYKLLILILFSFREAIEADLDMRGAQRTPQNETEPLENTTTVK